VAITGLAFAGAWEEQQPVMEAGKICGAWEWIAISGAVAATSLPGSAAEPALLGKLPAAPGFCFEEDRNFQQLWVAAGWSSIWQE
jgi:hypothetical protein